jgi:ADP-L-glycero-D-manno-heptose 6-epimerase
MIKACVTGSNGFIGRAMFNELENQGVIPIALEKWIFERARWQDRLVEYLHDMQPDVVFHIGACSDTQNFDVNEMMKLNVEATIIIADWCEFKNIPLIYSSSASIYGTKGTPETLYSWSKFLGENHVKKCGGIALRYFNVFGSNERHKGKMSSIACQSFYKNLNHEEVKLFPNNASRDFVYIKDVVSANIHAWKTYETHKGGHFDVGTGVSRTFEDVLHTMKIPYSYTSSNDIPNNYQIFTEADENKFLKDWKPKWFLEEAIEHYKAMLELTTAII